MLKYILQLTCITIICVNSAYSQVNISFGHTGISHEDTLSIGDTIHFNFWIVNQNNSILTDSLSIECETFDDNNNPISSMAIGLYYNTNGSLSAGDSIFISISEIISYASYKLGDNIVVIWPALINTTGNMDTSITNIHILDNTNNIIDFNKSEELLLFPNPNQGNFKIDFKEYAGNKEIEIFDLRGVVIFSKTNVMGAEFLYRKNLNKGIYFIRVRTNKKSYVMKIDVRQ